MIIVTGTRPITDLPFEPGGGKLIDPVERVTFVFEQGTHVARRLGDARYHDG